MMVPGSKVIHCDKYVTKLEHEKIMSDVLEDCMVCPSMRQVRSRRSPSTPMLTEPART